MLVGGPMVNLEIEILLNYVVSDSTADFVFNIHPAQTQFQSVAADSLYINGVHRTDLQAADLRMESIDTNRLLCLRAGPGPLSVRYLATVTIDHFVAAPAQLSQVSVNELPATVLIYLNPSRYCQSDRLQRFAMAEFGAVPTGYARVQAIAEWVRSRVTFQPQASNVNTSAMDTLVEQVGVCRDFAHLMIALCRAMAIPARFATSIDYGADSALGPPDFHAYVEVYLSGRWYIVDASGLAVPMGLVRLGTGRDAADVAFATIFGAVQSSMPEIRITARADPAQNVVMPSLSSGILSTDC